MFALKSARDSMNLGDDGIRRLMLVFTGSHRDKLANLILKKDQPFYGARLTDFPFLDKDYTDAYTKWINERLADDNQLSADDVFMAFDVIGRRPEILENIISDAVLGGDKSVALKQALANGALTLRNRLWDDFEQEFSSLSVNQRVVLSRLIEKGESFSPFSEESLNTYRQEARDESIDASAVQSALAVLCERNLVWKPARGVYSLDDQSMKQWFKLHEAQTNAHQPCSYCGQAECAGDCGGFHHN